MTQANEQNQDETRNKRKHNANDYRIQITDIFEPIFLQHLQDSFSEATGLAAIFVDYLGNPIVKYSNFTEHCLAVRKLPGCLDYCMHSDAHGGLESAKKGEPAIYVCHAGLVDLAVPIMVKGKYIGAILAGQVRIPEEEMKTLPIGAPGKITNYYNDAEITKLRNKTTFTTLDRVRAAGRLLFYLTNYLVDRQLMTVMQRELHDTNLELMEEVKQRSEAEAALKESELRAIQAQINPHFFFNVLNTIGLLAMGEGATKTQEMIYRFSDLLRYTLGKSQNDFVTLKEELEHTKNYLYIQKVRHGDRLRYDFDVDEELYNIMCPFMTVQPFVENAIKYAVEPSKDGAHIDITAHREGDDVVLHIIDDGVGISEARIDELMDSDKPIKSKKGTGIGVRNANKRLKYYYGPDHGISFDRHRERGTDVIIKIPVKTMPMPHGQFSN